MVTASRAENGNHPTESLFAEVKGEYPWFPLKAIDPGNGIYSSQPRPLTPPELSQVFDDLVTKNLRRGKFTTDIRDRNREMVDRAGGNISVVLDGRAANIEGTPYTTEGYLGDMVEASSAVTALSDLGANVTVFTPHIGTITPDPGRNIQVVELPISTPHLPHFPWTPETLQFIHHANPDSALFFPLNGSLPTFIRTNARGEILNGEDVRNIRSSIFGKNGIVDADEKRGRPVMKHTVWSREGLHQLQALQANLHLLGFDLNDQSDLPSSFLRPSRQAQQNATALSKEVFDGLSSSDGKVPLFIHVGVATGEKKVRMKYFPKDRWKKTIAQMGVEGLPINNCIFFIPSDKDQALDTMEIAQVAESCGQRVTYMPEHALASRHGWSLGTFVSFLQQLSTHRGIVLGCDSLPVHASAATGNRTVVIGNRVFSPVFYAPRSATLALPTEGFDTSSVTPEQVIKALAHTIQN